MRSFEDIMYEQLLLAIQQVPVGVQLEIFQRMDLDTLRDFYSITEEEVKEVIFG